MVIFLDVILRFAWTLTLVSADYITRNDLIILVPLGPNLPVTFLEIFRRTLWSVVRIENEHLNNTNKFREVDFVPLYFYEDDNRPNDSQEDKAEKGTIATLFAFLRVFLLLCGVVSLATWILRGYQ